MPAPRTKKKAARRSSPLVGVIMGSKSDWSTMEHCVAMLEELGVPHEAMVVSAHRTPDWLFEYVSGAEARGIEVIVAGAGGGGAFARDGGEQDGAAGAGGSG